MKAMEPFADKIKIKYLRSVLVEDGTNTVFEVTMMYRTFMFVSSFVTRDAI